MAMTVRQQDASPSPPASTTPSQKETKARLTHRPSPPLMHPRPSLSHQASANPHSSKSDGVAPPKLGRTPDFDKSGRHALTGQVGQQQRMDSTCIWVRSLDEEGKTKGEWGVEPLGRQTDRQSMRMSWQKMSHPSPAFLPFYHSPFHSETSSAGFIFCIINHRCTTPLCDVAKSGLPRPPTQRGALRSRRYMWPTKVCQQKEGDRGGPKTRPGQARPGRSKKPAEALIDSTRQEKKRSVWGQVPEFHKKTPRTMSVRLSLRCF